MVYFKINPDLRKIWQNGKRSIGQFNYYLTFTCTICIYCTIMMAEVIFLTVRNEVISLKRLYLRIYNYSVQITFLSKIPNYLTVINEYIRRFSWIYVTFVSCENVYGGSYKNWRHPTHFYIWRKYSLIANYHFTIVINKHSVLITHVHFSCSAHKMWSINALRRATRAFYHIWQIQFDLTT